MAGKKNKCYIIAEVGVNHNGSSELLVELILAAKKSGADACKFQTFKANDLVAKSAPKVEYQKRAANPDETQYEMLKELELSDDMHSLAIETCAAAGIDFISTPYSPADAYYLAELGVKKFKTASADLVDHRIHRLLAGWNAEVLIATGMATDDEIEEALNCYQGSGSQVTLLHCVSNYPCTAESINLRAMAAIQEKYGLPVGYSDHSEGAFAAITAVAMGAQVVERHFTLDKSLPGPDHSASSTPSEFKEIVNAIRRVETILGASQKSVQHEELQMRSIARKSVVALKKIAVGERLSEENLTMKRPGGGAEWTRIF